MNQPINQMVIKGDKASLTIDVAPTTTITIGKTKATLGDLKAEMSVMVSYKVEDGKNAASKIIEKAIPRACRIWH